MRFALRFSGRVATAKLLKTPQGMSRVLTVLRPFGPVITASTLFITCLGLGGLAFHHLEGDAERARFAEEDEAYKARRALADRRLLGVDGR